MQKDNAIYPPRVQVVANGPSGATIVSEKLILLKIAGCDNEQGAETAAKEIGQKGRACRQSGVHADPANWLAAPQSWQFAGG